MRTKAKNFKQLFLCIVTEHISITFHNTYCVAPDKVDVQMKKFDTGKMYYKT